MADNLKALSELVAAVQKIAPTLPRQLFYPTSLVKEAAELYKDQDWCINGHDGSQFYHGVQTKWPCTTMGTTLDVTRLNEKIAAMWQPNYLRQLQQIPPEERRVVLLGEWGSRRVYHGSRGCGKSLFPHNYDEEGDNHG